MKKYSLSNTIKEVQELLAKDANTKTASAVGLGAELSYKTEIAQLLYKTAAIVKESNTEISYDDLKSYLKHD